MPSDTSLAMPRGSSRPPPQGTVMRVPLLQPVGRETLLGKRHVSRLRRAGGPVRLGRAKPFIHRGLEHWPAQLFIAPAGHARQAIKPMHSSGKTRRKARRSDAGDAGDAGEAGAFCRLAGPGALQCRDDVRTAGGHGGF